MCDQSEFMALCVIFNLWVGPGFIFEPCGYILILLTANFLLLSLDYTVLRCVS